MRKIRRAFIWLFMLWKRMLKKPGYTVLLLLIVALAGAIAVFGDGGELVRVAIFADDESTQAVFEDSEQGGTVIKYDYFDSEDKALEAVTSKGYDAAWIISGPLEDAACRFAERGTPIVRVLQREDTVFLRLARERLYATIYPHISKAVYDEFMAENFDDPDPYVTDEYYYSQSESRQIIEIKFDNSEQKVSDLDLLTSPVRGLLAVAIFMCAYAALMSFKRDRDSGLFARTSEDRLVFVETAYIIVSVFNAVVLTLVSMKIAGIFTSLGAELLFAAVYVLLCTALCVVLGEMIDSISALGAVMPVLILVMLVVCPVFINLVDLPQLQLLLPPYYYLSALRDPDFVLYGFVYILVLSAVYAAIRCLKLIILKFKYKK